MSRLSLETIIQHLYKHSDYPSYIPPSSYTNKCKLIVPSERKKTLSQIASTNQPVKI